MNRISVGSTISQAYSFTFAQLGSIIGLAWVSLVAIAVLQFLPYAAGGDPTAAAANPLQAGQHAIQSLGVSILILILTSVNYVAVTRLALGLRPGGAIVHFALGLPEFRTFGAIVLFALVLFGLFVGFAIAGGLIVAAVSTLHNESIFDLTVVATALVFSCVLIFVIVRFGFLLVPATVAEDHVGLARAWTLSNGNFWRIFAVLLAVTLPLLAIELLGDVFIVGPGLFAPLPAGGNAASLALAARLSAIGQHAPMLIGLRLLLAPFQLGLAMGAAAFGYRALATPPAAAA